MLEHGRQRDRQRLRELADGCGSAAQAFDDRAPGRVGQRMEDRVGGDAIG
jgi:hypothetical protein